MSEGFVGGHIVPISETLQDRRGRQRQDRAAEETGRPEDLPGRPDRQRAQSLAAVAQLVVRRRARRAAQRSSRQARRRLAHPGCERRGARERNRASRRVRQGPAGSVRRRRARPDRQRDQDLHGREFRARQGPPALDRPAADERRVAGPAGHHGQGRGRRNATSAWPRSGPCSSTGGCPTASTRGWRRSADAPAPGPLRKVLKAAVWLVALVVAAIVAIAEFPNQVGKIIPPLAQLLPPPLPELAPVKAAHWLDQNWSTEDRHWFHHASQGTATFPVPYAWFVALEQPGLYLFSRPGLLADPHYLERFGFIPSPKTVRADAETLRRFGFVNAPGVKTEPAPEHGGRPEADAGRQFRRPAGRLLAHDPCHQSRHRRARIRQDRADLRGLPHRQHPLQGRQRPLRRRRRPCWSCASSRSRPVLPFSTR